MKVALITAWLLWPLLVVDRSGGSARAAVIITGVWILCNVINWAIIYAVSAKKSNEGDTQ